MLHYRIALTATNTNIHDTRCIHTYATRYSVSCVIEETLIANKAHMQPLHPYLYVFKFDCFDSEYHTLYYMLGLITHY